MAHRRIGQEVFRFGARAERQTSLDELGALIDWSRAAQVLSSLYPAVKGEKAWPPLAMFKALLLATWYDLSDVALDKALCDRASLAASPTHRFPLYATAAAIHAVLSPREAFGLAGAELLKQLALCERGRVQETSRMLGLGDEGWSVCWRLACWPMG